MVNILLILVLILLTGLFFILAFRARRARRAWIKWPSLLLSGVLGLLLQSLGSVLRKLNDPPIAHECYRRAVIILITFVSAEDPSLSSALRNLEATRKLTDPSIRMVNFH